MYALLTKDGQELGRAEAMYEPNGLEVRIHLFGDVYLQLAPAEARDLVSKLNAALVDADALLAHPMPARKAVR